MATRRFAASKTAAKSGSALSAALDPARLYVAMICPLSFRAIRKAKVAV